MECERLQTLPDNYTEAPGVTEAQRYKCLGNGWTVDVIAHILKYLKNGSDQKKDPAGRDWFPGQYYWEMDNGKYLCMNFEIY